jgi:hypothetical protein
MPDGEAARDRLACGCGPDPRLTAGSSQGRNRRPEKPELEGPPTTGTVSVRDHSAKMRVTNAAVLAIGSRVWRGEGDMPLRPRLTTSF